MTTGICIPGSFSSMYMDGFHFSLSGGNLPCMVLFTSAFVLDESWKFGLGCILVFLMAGTIEGFVRLRKKVGSLRIRGLKKKKAVLGVLFGLNMTLAYLAMLVAMTYSIELFASVILGLIAGHIFWKNENLETSQEPCCATQSSLAHNCQCR